jgi:hypothetical protein
LRRKEFYRFDTVTDRFHLGLARFPARPDLLQSEVLSMLAEPIPESPELNAALPDLIAKRSSYRGRDHDHECRQLLRHHHQVQEPLPSTRARHDETVRRVPLGGAVGDAAALLDRLARLANSI